MIAAEDAKAQLGKNFQNIELRDGSSFRDNSTVIILPTRGMIHHKTVSALMGLMPFMNQKRYLHIVRGDEVGQAYTETIKTILAHPELSTWKYIMTLEDDNLPPPDAQHKLIQVIDKFGFDAVSGLYWTKGDGGMPQAYGDPDHYRRTGELEFRPRDIRSALQNGQIMEVNGIAMGCAVFKMQMFRDIPPPWFVTQSEVTAEGPKAFTQDLYFCKMARLAGKRFAVDMRVTVGHMDVSTGEVY